MPLRTKIGCSRGGFCDRNTICTACDKPDPRNPNPKQYKNKAKFTTMNKAAMTRRGDDLD